MSPAASAFGWALLFDRTAFRRRFLDKGRMRAFLEPIPTWLVLRGDTGLIGAAHYRLGD